MMIVPNILELQAPHFCCGIKPMAKLPDFQACGTTIFITCNFGASQKLIFLAETGNKLALSRERNK
jgi:hypothetical protein